MISTTSKLLKLGCPLVLLTITNSKFRFGNYIGEAESDEDQDDQAQPTYKFDEAFDDEEEDEDEVNDQQLMEVDGMWCSLVPPFVRIAHSRVFYRWTFQRGHPP